MQNPGVLIEEMTAQAAGAAQPEPKEGNGACPLWIRVVYRMDPSVADESAASRKRAGIMKDGIPVPLYRQHSPCIKIDKVGVGPRSV